MYMIIDKISGKTIGFKSATSCANYLFIGRTTLYYWFKDKNKHETPKYIIYKADN